MTNSRALLVVFVANGLGLPSFLARLAERQRDLHLSDTALGLTVLGIGFGALVASPVAGWAVRRAGSRTVTIAAALALASTLWLAALAGSTATLFAVLALAGAADAVMDIGMNANGAAFEAAAGRSALHRLHAAWSVGALAAAALASVAAAAGLSLTAHLAVVGAVIAVAAVVSAPHLVARDSQPVAREHGARHLIPRAVVVIAIATIGAALVEGVGGEWSAVLGRRLGMSDALAPLATAAFMAGMVGGRLVGDRRTDRLGGAVVLRRGMALAALGLVAGAVIGTPIAFVAGVALAGAGVAGFFPLAFSSAVRAVGGAGAAVVSLGARAGFVAEPVLTGAIADASDLRVSFVVAGGVAAVIAAMATRIVVDT